MKMFENAFIGEESYFEAALPNLINAAAELSEVDKTKLAKYWRSGCHVTFILCKVCNKVWSKVHLTA